MFMLVESRVISLELRELRLYGFSAQEPLSMNFGAVWSSKFDRIVLFKPNIHNFDLSFGVAYLGCS